MSVQASAMFEKFSKKFEGNDRMGNRYQLVLLNGRVVSGVPSVAKGSTCNDPFSIVLMDGKSESVKWSRLLSASQIG